MSSTYVRTTFKSFMSTNATGETKQIDLTGQSAEMREFMNSNSISLSSNWIGFQFIGNSELPATVPATNDQGTYREEGAIYIHVIAPAAVNVMDSLLTRAETLRDLLRGRRIGEIRINEVTPVNTDDGATLQFDAGWMGASFLVNYERDKIL